ncbi:hypothetical protein GCM10009853_024390 [Glycomyces scopariae]
MVSGDCTVSIGMTAGLQRVGIDPAIVWIDAHGDLQSLETTTSGYLGGMALRLLLGYRADLVADPLRLRPPAPERVLLVDGRDLDPAESDYIAEASVGHRPLADLKADDLPEGPLLVNLDLDTLDPHALPGLRYPAPDGPDVATLLQAVQTIIDTGRVAAFNLACTWDPDPDPETSLETGAEATNQSGPGPGPGPGTIDEPIHGHGESASTSDRKQLVATILKMVTDHAGP